MLKRLKNRLQIHKIASKFPTYENVNSRLLLVGVAHIRVGIKDLIPGVSKMNRLARELKKCDKAMLEGTSKAFEIADKQGLVSYESLIYESFGEDAICMDDESDYSTLMQEQGCTKDTYAVLRLAQHFLGQENRGRDFESMQKGLMRTIEDCEKVSNDQVFSDNEHTMHLFSNLIIVLLEKWDNEKIDDNLFELVHVMREYLVILRDKKVYFPKIKQVAESTRGKVGVVIGGFHAERLSRMFRGIEDDSMPTWPEYVESQDEEKRELMEQLEKAIKLTNDMLDIGVEGGQILRDRES